MPGWQDSNYLVLYDVALTPWSYGVVNVNNKIKLEYKFKIYVFIPSNVR